ncbi:MAG TPA: DeoR/GlpR family DNA-binding transcription regulator [Opitutus sp.]|nr:DeoR/GlpR family DNA-binding transcription regulator [Opitutus sp.]
MIAQKRQQLILTLLREHSPLTVPELERRLRASPATVRRDLTFLEQLGKIVRTHGGLMHPDDATGEVPFDRKSRAALAAKQGLADAAAALVEAGGTVFVDAGTTAFEVGKRLLAQKDLTIVTNSIPLLPLRAVEGTRVIALGGEVRIVSLALVGAGALEWVKRIKIDVAFLGTSGIDPADGPTTTELSEAGLKSAIVAKARRVAVLGDASKWGRPATIRYADWAQVHDLFTDHTPTRAERAALATRGTKLHVVAR